MANIEFDNSFIPDNTFNEKETNDNLIDKSIDGVDSSDMESNIDFPKYLLPIDSDDTISTLIYKLNKNFMAITGTGIFFKSEDEPEDDHENLCDALLIKPHPPIHRRKRILEPLESRTNTDWLQNVDYLLGDVVIIEQKRNDNSGSNQVFMYTIAKKDDDSEDIEFINETELTGPAGKNAQIYLSYDSQTQFENTHFDTLNTTHLNVSSISFSTGGKLSVSEIITNKLSIGNITFYNNGDNCELGSNVLKVGTIYGFRGETDTVTFGSPIIVDFISSSDKIKPITIETSIRVNKIGSIFDESDDIFGDNPIEICSPLISDKDGIEFKSPICVDKIKSNKGDIEITSPIKVDNISTCIKDRISISSPISVDKIYSSNELAIETPITSSKKIDVNTPVNFTKDVSIIEDLTHFKQYDYNDKHKTHGRVFLAFDNIQNITIPEFNSNNYDLKKLGTPYSFVPTNSIYNIAKVTCNGETWYMLVVESNRISKEDNIRIVTTKKDIAGTDIEDEQVYELIASNDIYKDIYNCLINTSNYSSNNNGIVNINQDIQTLAAPTATPTKPYKTIGFSSPTSFSTYTNCTINVVKIGTLNNNFGLGDIGLIYYLTLY